MCYRFVTADVAYDGCGKSRPTRIFFCILLYFACTSSELVCCLDCPAFCVLSLLNISMIIDMGLVYKTRQILQERDTVSAYYCRLRVGDVLYLETSYYSVILF